MHQAQLEILPKKKIELETHFLPFKKSFFQLKLQILVKATIQKWRRSQIFVKSSFQSQFIYSHSPSGFFFSLLFCFKHHTRSHCCKSCREKGPLHGAPAKQAQNGSVLAYKLDNCELWLSFYKSRIRNNFKCIKRRIMGIKPRFGLCYLVYS